MENNEKVVINAAQGTAEIIIRHGEAEKLLDPKAPLSLNISGQLSCVAEYIRKRLNTGQFKQQDCRILVDRENVALSFVFNERDAYNNGSVEGRLSLHPDFESLAINRNHAWAPVELAMLLKMHRYWFEDRQKGMQLVSTLMNYKADINQKVEQSVEANGNRADNFAQVVNSNLPATITLSVPIFKGSQPQPLEIEFFAKVDGRDVSFILLSPGANEALEAYRDAAIDKELDDIRALAPDIAIIEK